MVLLRLPIFALMLGLVALAMLGPAAYALLAGDERSARSFLYAGLFSGAAAGVLGLSIGRVPPGRSSARRELMALLVCWAVLPVFAAIPLFLVTPGIGVAAAVFEMTAAFTTTGGTVYGSLETVPSAIHLWRGTAGWLGGFLSLTAAWVR